MTAEAWNAAVPVGSTVRYHPQGRPSRLATTSSVAWTAANGHAMVRLKGKPTGVRLAKLEIV